MNNLPDTGLTTGLANEDELTRRSYYLATTPAMEAFPPLAGSEAADVCVVGGGLAGLSTAIELRAKGYSVVLLEGQRAVVQVAGRRRLDVVDADECQRDEGCLHGSLLNTRG